MPIKCILCNVNRLNYVGDWSMDIRNIFRKQKSSDPGKPVVTAQPDQGRCFPTFFHQDALSSFFMEHTPLVSELQLNFSMI